MPAWHALLRLVGPVRHQAVVEVERPLQTGNGGKYAYLDVSPDNPFVRHESASSQYSHCLQFIDVEGPTKPKFVANWSLPGLNEGWGVARQGPNGSRGKRLLGEVKTRSGVCSLTCFRAPTASSGNRLGRR